MNKYASGYALVNIFAVLGVILIIVSFVLGALIAGEGGGLGYVMMIFGAFQGLIIVGMGSLGRAVLDGSVAQQEILEIHRSNKGKDRNRGKRDDFVASKANIINKIEKKEQNFEPAESPGVWDIVDKVEMLASSGKMAEAVADLRGIEDTAQLAWASFSVAEAYNASGDTVNFRKFADEALLAAHQIVDSEEREAAINAIDDSLRKVR